MQTENFMGPARSLQSRASPSREDVNTTVMICTRNARKVALRGGRLRGAVAGADIPRANDRLRACYGSPMATSLTASPEEGRITLERMEGATNYNVWLGRKFREHLGRRILEVGAGLGTITEQIADGRELVVALEVEEHYVAKLRERFQGRPQVRPYLSDVALADWASLKQERFDSIVLSNVLEH